MRAGGQTAVVGTERYDDAAQLARALADGQWHPLPASCAGATVALPEAAGLAELLGLQLQCNDGRCRLPTAITLLRSSAIRQHLTCTGIGLQVHDLLDSTNNRASLVLRKCGERTAVLAEFQTAGRGQHGRQWIAPFGSGMCLSLAWLGQGPLEAYACITLVAGVAVSEALSTLGVHDVRLKWPNDLFLGDAKLGGILVQSRIQESAAGAPSIQLVAGVGINADLSNAASAQLSATDYPVADLRAYARQLPVDRNRLAAQVIDSLAIAFQEFSQQGFSAFHARWAQRDYLAGRWVRSVAHEGATEGIACGVDSDGALLIEHAGTRHRVVSASGSVRVLAQERA